VKKLRFLFVTVLLFGLVVYLFSQIPDEFRERAIQYVQPTNPALEKKSKLVPQGSNIEPTTTESTNSNTDEVDLSLSAIEGETFEPNEGFVPELTSLSKSEKDNDEAFDPSSLELPPKDPENPSGFNFIQKRHRADTRQVLQPSREEKNFPKSLNQKYGQQEKSLSARPDRSKQKGFLNKSNQHAVTPFTKTPSNNAGSQSGETQSSHSTFGSSPTTSITDPTKAPPKTDLDKAEQIVNIASTAVDALDKLFNDDEPNAAGNTVTTAPSLSNAPGSATQQPVVLGGGSQGSSNSATEGSGSQILPDSGTLSPSDDSTSDGIGGIDAVGAASPEASRDVASTKNSVFDRCMEKELLKMPEEYYKWSETDQIIFHEKIQGRCIVQQSWAK
jgi:hypothetical protein